MKRAMWSVAFFAVGLLASWQSALLSNEIGDKFAWPVVRLHGCWDVEHCRIAPWGYALILLSLSGPALLWACVGFRRSGNWNKKRFILEIIALLVATMLFYLLLYALV
jgi:hypothetical protein